MGEAASYDIAVEGRAYLPGYVTDSKLEERLSKNQMYSLRKKYLLRDDDGIVSETPSEAIYRMARTMASVEERYGANQEDIDNLTEEFYHMIDIETGGFSPAGRIWTNAGTQIGGLFNCYVLPVHDSMDREEEGSIFNSVADAAVIHKNGGGTGYNFSELRPRGSYVGKSKGIASGPVSFIGQFDVETDIINSGNRRGANMGILNIDHPDILDFITAKTERGKITNFNISVGVTDEFMRAAEADGFYTLRFKGEAFDYRALESIIRNVEENKIGGSEVGEIPDPVSLRFGEGEFVPGKITVLDSYSGNVAGRVNEEGHVQLSARYVMDKIAQLAHRTGDPGMIFLDRINADNPLPNMGSLLATNPCGEQPLHPYDACNLGSIVLPRFVKFVKTNDGVTPEIDWEKLRYTVKLATRFMDNVNDANIGPIPQIERTVLNNRRIGMGVMGWADMLVEMRLSYESPEAIQLARKVMGFITDTAKEASVEIAEQKGIFPAFPGSVYDNGKLEDRVRNVQRTTIAPTGTIAMVYDVASGIEPFFAIAFRKNIRGGDSLYYFNSAFQREAEGRGLDLEEIAPLIDKNHGSVQGLKEVPEDLQKLFRTAHDLDYKAHIAAQAAFQEKTDNAVSKTINMKQDSTEEDVKAAYMLAWKSGLKGITVYRDRSKDVQVLQTGHGKGKDRTITRKELSDLVMAELKRPRPRDIMGRTEEIVTPFGDAFITYNTEKENGSSYPYESFIAIGKAGGDVTAISEGYGRLISMALKAGISPEYIVKQLEGIGGRTQSGLGSNIVMSLPDGIAKGIKKLMELDGNKVESKGNGVSGDLCPSCGGPLAMEEGCRKCLDPVCGFSRC